MKTELFTIYAPGVEQTLCAIVGEQAIYYNNGTKHVCDWREVRHHIMRLEIVEEIKTPSATFKIPADWRTLNWEPEDNFFLSDYKAPEQDYDEWMEQEMDDTMRHAAEDYERQLIERP